MWLYKDKLLHEQPTVKNPSPYLGSPNNEDTIKQYFRDLKEYEGHIKQLRHIPVAIPGDWKECELYPDERVEIESQMVYVDGGEKDYESFAAHLIPDQQQQPNKIMENIENEMQELYDAKYKISEAAEVNDLLRSFLSVCERKGATTNWEALTKRVRTILELQHTYGKSTTPPPTGERMFTVQQLLQCYKKGWQNGDYDFDESATESERDTLKSFFEKTFGINIYQ